jgi:hypothetical protein
MDMNANAIILIKIKCDYLLLLYEKKSMNYHCCMCKLMTIDLNLMDINNWDDVAACGFSLQTLNAF